MLPCTHGTESGKIMKVEGREEMIAGEKVMEEWEGGGTTIVRGAMGWLFEDGELADLIKVERLMYPYHQKGFFVLFEVIHPVSLRL